MSDGRIVVERRGHVARITTDYAARRNTLTETMRTELAAAMAAADEDREVRAIVLTGGVAAFLERRDARFVG